MNPTTLGDQIKAKYPQYAQYPSDMLGQRWIDVHQKKAASGSGSVDMSLLGNTQTPILTPNVSSNNSSGLDISGIDSLLEGGTSTDPTLNIAGLSGNSGLTAPGGVDFRMPKIQSSATPQTTNLGNNISAVTYGSPIMPSSNTKPVTSLSQIDFNKKLFDGRGGLSR